MDGTVHEGPNVVTWQIVMRKNRTVIERRFLLICKGKEEPPMELIDEILQDSNLTLAVKRVVSNQGAPGIDNMPVKDLREYFEKERTTIKTRVLQKKYKPSPVRRVYIPKPNGKKRPLGIPTGVDRVLQQAVAQKLSEKYDAYFSSHSYGFRPGRDCHQAIGEVLEYLNEGYEWVIDMDISKFFDTVNHDKLISILRERVNDAPTLHLIRSFLKVGAMENGVVVTSEEGVPQGGPLSPILANIYLDKMDKELEARGLRFVRYADDCDIFVRSEAAANRVMKSITSWIERKLYLKVNAEKTKVVRPKNSTFLGFTFRQRKDGRWICAPSKDRMKRLKARICEILQRNRAAARTNGETFKMLNQVITGWINYFCIGEMTSFMERFGTHLRHKVRVIILKQWKKPRTIIRNLMTLCKILGYRMYPKREELIISTGCYCQGLWAQANLPMVNYLIPPKLLSQSTSKRCGLIDPLKYYLSRRKSCNNVAPYTRPVRTVQWEGQ